MASAAPAQGQKRRIGARKINGQLTQAASKKNMGGGANPKRVRFESEDVNNWMNSCGGDYSNETNLCDMTSDECQLIVKDVSFS